MTSDKKDLLAMKLLHYFITEENYNPVIIHGIQDEIWLENMDAEFKIVRIVLHYIHNKEQFDFDVFKVGRLSKQIKMKTFSFRMKTLSLYLDLNDDVTIEDTKKSLGVNVKNERSLKNSEVIKNYFPEMPKKLVFNEKGALLYEKINADILKKNLENNEKINDMFSERKPIITNILIGLCVILFVLMYVLGNGSEDTKTLYFFGALIKKGSIIRIISSMFLHIGILHLLMNMWALKILGSQNENFYGHIKTLFIFIYSGIVGNLLSIILMNNSTISAGASGAIFGLMGSLLYFAYNQRTYMAEALKKDIIPVIAVNLVFSVAIPSINLYAHLGGLVGGFIIAGALGIKHKTSKFEKINYLVVSLLLVLMLGYVAYFM